MRVHRSGKAREGAGHRRAMLGRGQTWVNPSSIMAYRRLVSIQFDTTIVHDGVMIFSRLGQTIAE